MKDKNSLITDVWKYGNSTKSLWIFPLVYLYSPTLLSPDSLSLWASYSYFWKKRYHWLLFWPVNQVPHSQVIKMHLHIIQRYCNVNILGKYYRLYNAIVSVIVSPFWEREIHRRRKWAVTPKDIYYMVFQSKMESKSELASFLTSEAECEKITYVAKHIFIL